MVSWADVLVRRRHPPGDRAVLLDGMQGQLQALMPPALKLCCDYKNLQIL